MKVNLITAIYGNHDLLNEIPAGHGFDETICYTDDPDLTSDSWTVIYMPSHDYSRRMASKFPKFLPWEYSDADAWVWLDASFQILDTGFKTFCLNALGDRDLVVWDHPDRGSRPDVYAEARFSTNMDKYRGEPLMPQTAHYAAQGLPPGSGLYACGTIVWRDTPANRAFGEAWMQENLRWTYQDQVSFPYLVWKLQPNLATFPAHEYENPYLQWIPHRTEL